MAKKTKKKTTSGEVKITNAQYNQILGQYIDLNFTRINAANSAIQTTNVYNRNRSNWNHANLATRGSVDGTYKKIIQDSVSAYKTCGIIRNIIDLMADFAAQGVSIVHPNDKEQLFYDKWASLLNDGQGLNVFTEQFFRALYKTANVAIVKHLYKVQTSDKRNMLKFKSLGQFPTYRPPTVIKNTIPLKYQIMNSARLSKDGPWGKRRIRMQLDTDTLNIIRNPKTPEDIEYVNTLDPTWVQKIKDGTTFIVLGPQTGNEFFSMIYYKKDHHEDWADPIVYPVIEDVAYKQLLRRMDESAAKSIIDAIRIVKLGKTKGADKQNDYIPKPQHITKMKELLNTPSRAQTLVWSDQISIESDYAPIEKILGKEKYEQVDQDILTGLGISQVIAGGGTGGGTYANSFLSVKTLVEKLQTGRSSFESFLLKQIDSIRRSMGFKTMPIVKFGRMNLRDQAAQKGLIVQLLDRNILSAQTALKYFDENYSVQLQRMHREEERFQKLGPYRIDPDQLQMKKDQIKIKKDNPGPDKDVTKQKDKNGRPRNIKSPQKVKRDTKPQGMGEQMVKHNYSDYLINVAYNTNQALEMYDALQKILVSKFCTINNVKLPKQLTYEQRGIFDELLFNVFSNLNIGDKITQEMVDNLLQTQAPAKLDRCVQKVYKQLVNKQQKKGGKLTKDKKKKLRSSAWGICRSQTNL